MKKILTVVLAAVMVIIAGVTPTYSQETPQTQSTEDMLINVFKRDDCAHCIAEHAFLDELVEKREDIEVKYYDVNDPESKVLWEKIVELEGLSKVTPITLIDYNIIVGFGSEDTTGQQIIEIINRKEIQRVEVEEFIENGGSKSKHESGETCEDPSTPCEVEPEPILVKIPFTNKVIDVKSYSLPVLSAVLGLIDGFNPCAMWVLVTFMFILIQVGDRRKMWTIAGIFILAEAIMYHLILSVWFSAWDFVGLNKIVTPLVGLLAIGSGLFFLYEWKTSDGTCKVTNPEQRKKISARIQDLAKQKFTIFTLLGIIGLAFSVNIIEFACSIGIPQTFTKILEINFLNFWQTELYILIYILFYMFDDFLVFGIALYSFEKIGLTQKYSRISNLIGGLLMLILGLILIFKPELLYLL